VTDRHGGGPGVTRPPTALLRSAAAGHGGWTARQQGSTRPNGFPLEPGPGNPSDNAWDGTGNPADAPSWRARRRTNPVAAAWKIVTKGSRNTSASPRLQAHSGDTDCALYKSRLAGGPPSRVHPAYHLWVTLRSRRAHATATYPNQAGRRNACLRHGTAAGRAPTWSSGSTFGHSRRAARTTGGHARQPGRLR